MENDILLLKEDMNMFKDQNKEYNMMVNEIFIEEYINKFKPKRGQNILNIYDKEFYDFMKDFQIKYPKCDLINQVFS